MPRESLLRARAERKRALIDTMVLAASADGKITQVELRALLRHLLERPEFDGTKPDELNRLIEGAAAELAKAQGMDQVLRSLRERLPEHKNRLLAFGLAASVAFADHRASPAELGLLKTFQMGLGISEEEVGQIVETVAQGRSLTEALGEPLERLYAEAMVLVMMADGPLHEDEARVLVENLAADPAFREVDRERAEQLVAESLADVRRQGLPARLTALARGIATRGQRLKAFQLAARVARATGRARPGELKLLELLQATFGLADDEVERVAKEA